MSETVTQRPTEGRCLARALATLRAGTDMDVAFGGPALASGKAFEIKEMAGTRTRSLAQLVVSNGLGLGGKALALGRPVSVTNYLQADDFTHSYDHAVRPEGLQTVAALPVVVDRTPRLMIYLASRGQIELGDRWFEKFGPFVRRLERDIAVDDEVRRRLALLTDPAPPAQQQLTRHDLRDIAHELGDLANQVGDSDLQARLEAVRMRFDPASTPSELMPRHAPGFTRREIDVLEQVSRGLSNREAAQALGLLPNTVKAYLKTAMRKLEATNRVQAVVLAREAGAID